MSFEPPSFPLLSTLAALPEASGKQADTEIASFNEDTLDFNTSRHQLDLALEAGHMGAWEWDIEHGRVYWSPQLHQLFGIPNGTFEGTLEGYRARIHPDDRDASLSKVQDALARRAKTHHVLHRILHPNGDVRWLHAHARFFYAPDGRPLRLVGITRDVTDLRNAEEALHQQHALTEQALREETQLVETLQHIGNALTSKLELGTIVQTVTDEATKLTTAQFGAFFYNVTDTKDDSYMLYTISGVPRETFAQFPMPRNTLLFEEAFRGEGVVRSGDVRQDPRYGHIPPHYGMPEGHLPVVSYLSVPVFSHTGEVLGALFFGHDQPNVFTERHERLVVGIAGWAGIAMDNARLFEDQRTARAEAERANRAKSEFLATMSHELRTPLNAIGGFAQLVGDGLYGPITDGQRESMRRIRRAEEHLLTLINDILNFARIEAGRLRLDMQEVKVGGVVHELSQLIEPQATKKGLLLVPADSPRHACVLADRGRLQQILLNLLGNAIKFTDTGRITINWTTDDVTVRICVQDTGCGVPADKLSLIFEPFEQVTREPKLREGLGLGLAISRELARAMGGDITVQSTLGVGSTFIVSLPQI
jgi:PAS domain S-box-containing protein